MRETIRTRSAALVGALTMVAGLAVGVAPASAEEANGQITQGSVEASVCDVEVDAKVVNIAHTHDNGEHVDHTVSPVIPLDEPIPAGRVLTSGVTTDVGHFEDRLDFTTEKSQFEEQVTIRFLNVAGDILAETDPTPDLPDVAPYAPFALPSVDLAEEAVAIQVAHAATGDGLNSVNAPCIDFVSVDAKSLPSDYLQPVPCPIDGPAPLPFDSVCGFLAVPEDRDDPESRHINVAFGIVLGDGSHPDPFVWLRGGPGGTSVNSGGFFYNVGLNSASDGRDVILIDQRGTGYSQPNLACIEQEDYAEVFETEEEFLAAQESYLSDCYERLLASGADLSSYTTVENAADIADLRIALGLDEWNLFGTSYGTDLALTIMRDRPEGVRSVTLDSVFPPEVNVTAGEDSIGFLKSLDRIAERCAADRVCDSANPDLRNSIIAAVDNLNAEPALVSGTEAQFLVGQAEFYFDGFTLLSVLAFDFADPNIAALISGAASADAATRQAAVDNYHRDFTLRILGLSPELAQALKADYRGVPGTGTENADGFFFTVSCAEEFPFTSGTTSYDGEPWSEAIDLFVESIDDFFDFKEECAIFDVDAEDPAVNEPVVSDLPTLIVYTDNDVQTPPEWAELTAESLPNSDLVFFNNLGHAVTFFDVCPQQIIAQFLSDPGGELDTSCTELLPPIYYEAELPEIGPLPPIDELLGPPLDEEGPIDEEAPVDEEGGTEQNEIDEGGPSDEGPSAALAVIDVRAS